MYDREKSSFSDRGLCQIIFFTMDISSLTAKNDYITSEWHILKVLENKGCDHQPKKLLIVKQILLVSTLWN